MQTVTENILVADIGNTNIVVGYFAGDELKFTIRIPTHEENTSQSYAEKIRSALEDNRITGADGAVMASVVPKCSGALSEALKAVTGEETLIVTPDMETGLDTSAYDAVHLGMDRLVDAAAAAYFYGMPVVTFDLGTCSTVNVIDEHANYLGGMIAAGIQLSLDAVGERAAQLPHVNAGAPSALIGTDTSSCILNGAVIGAASMIDGIAERVRDEICSEGQKLNAVITGGLGRYALPWCRNTSEGTNGIRLIYDPDLLLRGLLHLYRLNCRRPSHSEDQ